MKVQSLAKPRQEQLNNELLEAARNGNIHKIRDLIQQGAEIEAKNSYGDTPLHIAVWNTATVAKLLALGAAIEAKDKNGWTPLHRAAWDGKTETVAKLLELGADIEAKTSNGNTPLHIIAGKGNTKTVVKLIALGAAIEAKDKNGWTPLHIAAEKGNTEDVVKLIALGADREARNKEECTPLHIAAGKGNIEIVTKLIELGADREAKDKNGFTPLHMAAGKGNIEIVAKLIELGADREAKDKNGWTPLHIAAWHGKIETVAKLLELGAAIETKTNHGDTPLHIVAGKGNTEIVVKLIALGADREARNKEECTPLHIAAGKGNIEIVVKLIELGADREAKDKNGFTPLHMAAGKGNTEIVAKLIALGAAIEAKDKNGWTPLHIAAWHGKIETVAKLLELDAAIEAKNKNGFTPLHIAAEKGNIENVAKLLELGADIEAKTNNGGTPLFYAEKGGHTQIVTLLKNWSKDQKNTLTQVAQSSVSSGNTKEKQPQVAIPEVPAEKVTEAVVALQTELDHPKAVVSALEQSAQLQNNKSVTNLTDPSPLKRSTESRTLTTPPPPQAELPKVTEVTQPITSSSQVSEESLSQVDMTSLKMSALLSLREQQTQLTAEIQKLQERTQATHSASKSKRVSLTPEQEEALNKLAYKQAQLKALEQLKASPNLGEFYQTLVINIEALCLAIKTAQTNLMKIELQGTAGKAAQVTQAISSLLEAIPVIGNTAKSVSSVATKLLTKFDEHLIAQKLKQLHELGTQKQWQTFILKLAKFLTLRYEDQLIRLLPTPTKAASDSPAKALANYVVISLFDHLMSYSVTMTNLLISSRPVTLTFEQVRAEFLEKLAPCSQSTFTELSSALLTFLSKDTVISTSGKKLSLQAILTKPGIRVGETAFFDHDAGKLTNAAEYGYRLGTEQEALQYKLIKSTNKAPHLSASKPTASVASSMPNPLTPEPKEQAVKIPVEVASATLPKAISVSSKQEPTQAMDFMQVLQRLEALEKANQEKDKEIALLKQQRNQPSPNSWVGRVQEVSVGNQVLIKKELLQSDSLYDLSSPQLQTQKVDILEERIGYTEQELSHLKESVDVVTKIALGIRTASVIQQTTASTSQKGTSPSK